MRGFNITFEDPKQRIEEKQGLIYSTDVEGNWSIDIDRTLQRLSEKIEELRNEYYRNRFSALEIKDKDTQFKSKLGFFGVEPVDQPETVANANSQGGTYSQTDVQSIATAVNAVIARLKELGLIK